LAANLPFEVLCVCSDDTVGKKGSDEAIHSITDVAFPVTSNVEEIRKFLYRSGPKVVFSTYQSSPLVAEAQGVATVPGFDLAIADEAHRCAGKVGNDFTTILDAKLIRAKKRLFATATPRTYSTNVKKAAGERGIDVVGMDDEAVFGKVSYSLPFGEAIKRGLLTDYQVVIIGVDNPTIAAWIENRELVKTESGIESDAESLAAQIGLLKAYKDYDLRRVISFHSRVKRAEQFSKDLINVNGWVSAEHKPTGSLKTDFVSGEMATDKRRIKLAQLKSLSPQERGLLTNARCLSEGVDVPSLDGVAFIDPRSSQIDIIQAVGRAIRLSTNKTAGTIILPVFIESGIDAVASIEESNFKPIWDVLNALKAHDDVLSAELDQLRTEMGRKGKSAVDPRALAKIHIDLPASVDQSFGESLRTHLVERVTNSWDFWFGLLQEYAAKHGNCRVNDSFKASDKYALGTWVTSQRSKRETMPQERQRRLEGLRSWLWDPREEAWESGFQYLREYEDSNGGCSVPQLYKSPSGFALGSWVTAQRSTQEKMPLERRAMLESLHGWIWDLLEEAWEVGYRYLSDYCNEHGSCFVPQSMILPDGFAFGRWVSKQRTKREKMSHERQARLEALQGWTWDPRDAAWESGILHLEEYRIEHGDCLVPRKHKSTDGYAIGSWVFNQRVIRDKLAATRKARLESINGWVWQAHEEAWDTGFQYLSEYCQEHGNCLVPSTFDLPNGYKLGTWVGNQRTNRELMQIERRVRLEALQGWEWGAVVLKMGWKTGFRYLNGYCEGHGNCLVPSTYVHPDGFALGRWVSKQRSRRDEMPFDRRAFLDGLYGWVWDPFEEAWETGFQYLSEYCQEHGNCLVPGSFMLPNGYTLGTWVGSQRSNRAKLATARLARLESLHGWVWDSVEQSWETGFRHLKDYCEANGNCLVPQSLKLPDGYLLGKWLSRQRTKRGEMSLERQTRLEALPGWNWKTRKSPEKKSAYGTTQLVTSS
jgi:hypothetical protein